MSGATKSKPTIPAPAETSAPAVAAAAPTRPEVTLIGWRESFVIALAVTLISVGALLTEYASKRYAIAADRAPGQGLVSYVAGWPFIYARVNLVHLSARTYNAVIANPPRLRIIDWWALLADTTVAALIFALGIAAIIAVFAWAWRVRPHNAEKKPSLRRFVTLSGIAFVCAAVWLFMSSWYISGTVDTQLTDGATVRALIQFPGVVLLAPGVMQYLTQLWFENDHFLAIGLSGGAAATVEAVGLLATGLALPTAICSLIGNGVARFTQWWQKQ